MCLEVFLQLVIRTPPCLQGLSLGERAGSGWLQHAAQQGGIASQQGSLAQALSPAGSLQSQLPAQPSPGGKPPHGSASKLGPSRLGVGSPPGAAAAAFAAASPAMTTASSASDGATSPGSGDPNTSMPGVAAVV